MPWPGDRACLHYLIACGHCEHCTLGNEQFCAAGSMLGHYRDGGWAEYIAVPERKGGPDLDWNLSSVCEEHHRAIHRGEIRVRGEPIRGTSLDRGIVFQHFALFPWKTVRANKSSDEACASRLPIGRVGGSPAARVWPPRVGIALGFGRPAHVYDLAKLRGSVVARRARDGEQILALNENTMKLEPATVSATRPSPTSSASESVR